MVSICFLKSYSPSLSLSRSLSASPPSLALPPPLQQDLLNFDDPLNIDAAEHHLRDKVEYRPLDGCSLTSPEGDVSCEHLEGLPSAAMVTGQMSSFSWASVWQ